MAIEPNSTMGANSSKKASVNDLRERESFSETNRFEACFLFLRKRLRAECSTWKDLSKRFFLESWAAGLV